MSKKSCKISIEEHERILQEFREQYKQSGIAIVEDIQKLPEAEYIKTEDILSLIMKVKKRMGIEEIMWKNNTICPNCGKKIEDPKRIRCAELGNSYCSDNCAKEYVNKNYKPEGEEEKEIDT